MTLAELLQYLDDNTCYTFLDGTPAETLAKSLAGTHKDALAGRIINAIAEHCGSKDVDSRLERTPAVNALGPLRLEYMKDDAPVEGFRMVERVIQAIDGAFNEEALRRKESGR